MQDYNAEIYAGGQSGLTDPFAYEEAPLDLAAYGYDDDVLAVLWIPRLNLELPVYLGASRENLAKGAALLGQTSMPLGGENTNTVIAAHRGYYGAEMLRNVQQIQVGDKIQLTTPWETLIYRVSELKIIDPSDINAVLIQPGRDLLTLSTCHPYTRNSQRYLVIAEHDTAAADKPTSLCQIRKMVLGQVLHLYNASSPTTGPVGTVELKHSTSTTIGADCLFHSLILLDGRFGQLLPEKENLLKLCRSGFEHFSDFLLSKGIHLQPVV